MGVVGRGVGRGGLAVYGGRDVGGGRGGVGVGASPRLQGACGRSVVAASGRRGVSGVANACGRAGTAGG